MSRKLNQADLWLVDEVKEALREKFHVSGKQVGQCIDNSNLLPLLIEYPDFAHHETPQSWASTIAKQNKLPLKGELISF